MGRFDEFDDMSYDDKMKELELIRGERAGRGRVRKKVARKKAVEKSQKSRRQSQRMRDIEDAEIV